MKLFQYLLQTLNDHLRKKTPSDSEKGAITVAETLIALGVGTTILAVVFAGIPALVAARNVSTGINGLTQIVSSVRMTFGVRNNFNGLNTELAGNLAGFPRHFLVNGANAPQHPWNGNVAIAGTGRTFTVEFEGMPDDACSSLVATTAEMAQTISIGGTALNLGADEDDSDSADIAGLCSASPPNNVIWTFRG